MKENLVDSQVFIFNENQEWKDISDKYFKWNRGPIIHPLYPTYCLNLTNKNSQPSYVSVLTWQKYKAKALQEGKP